MDGALDSLRGQAEQVLAVSDATLREAVARLHEILVGHGDLLRSHGEVLLQRSHAATNALVDRAVGAWEKSKKLVDDRDPVALTAVAVAAAAASYGLYAAYRRWRRQSSRAFHGGVDGPKAYMQLIGNTPLVQLHAASRLLGRRIYVKMESMNPGGTGKDRAAKCMLQDALAAQPRVAPPKDMYEGTSGSTGISLACLCNAMGLKLTVVRGALPLPPPPPPRPCPWWSRRRSGPAPL